MASTLLLLLLGGTASTALALSFDEFEELRTTIHKLPPAESKRRILQAAAAASPPPHQDKIDHLVVLYMENHAFDNYFGCNAAAQARGADIALGHTIPVDPTNASAGTVNFTCGTTYGYVCPGGPGYDLFAGKFKPGEDPTTYPYGVQSDSFSYSHGASGIAMQGFTPEQVPVKSAIVESYGLFNKMYASVPSASTPNHLFSQSATSCGIHDNIMYSDCGGATNTFPQMTIFDSLAVNGVDFGLFMNSTCGTNLPNATGDPCHSVDPNTPSAGSPIPTPDVAMSGVGRHADHFYSQQHFYERAANGTLPAFSWFMPPTEACDHPCYDVAKGERLLKDIYEALRAGPKWSKTLFLITYDDTGAYYDHMVPPHEGVPNDDAPCHVNDQCGSSAKFDFRRLGLRTAAMLVSPWVAEGAVFQEPNKGPFNTSQFDHTSILATAKSLFNLTGFLTKRDAWAGNFEELLLDTPRPDEQCPMHLPDAPPPAQPWGPPPNKIGFVYDGDDDDDDDDRRQLAVDASGSISQPQHCGRKDQLCRGPTSVSTKLRRKMREISMLLGVELPAMDAMSGKEAGAWYREHYMKWINAGSPIN